MKYLFLFSLLVISIRSEEIDPLSDEYFDLLNEQDLTWKAGRNFDPSLTMEEIRRLLGVKIDVLRSKPRARFFSEEESGEDIPESFDAREEWPDCESLRTIRDQSNCGSCWAVAAVEAMSDRICIHSDQKNHTELSAADLLSCCEKCGDGCDGGYPAAAWEYWYENGIVTESCEPYPFENCSHHVNSPLQNCSSLDPYDTPACISSCTAEGLTFTDEITYGSEPYAINSIEREIQLEIMKYGPVEASFDVFSDFLWYQSGVYSRTENATSVGGHAVKILGWGVDSETKTKYWLIANSWNEYWGEDGYFRMIRGENDCGIESNIVAAMPRMGAMSDAARVGSVVSWMLAAVMVLIFL